MSTLTPEDRQKATQRLAAGRIKAMDAMPYLSRSLNAMIPHPRPGLGTFAVDKRWRMYYEPQLCLDWTIDELAAAWLHECFHLMRDHSGRFEKAEAGEIKHAPQWNHAADATINSDLAEVGIVLEEPESRFYAKPNELYPEWRPGMTTEQMFDVARKKAGGDSQEKQGDAPSDEDEDSDGTSDEKEKSSDPDSEEAGDSEDSEDNEDKEKSDSSTGSSGDNEDEESDEEESESDSSSSGSENDEVEDSEEDNSESGTSPGEGEEDSESGTSEKTPKETGCGSGATGGAPKDYEEQDIDDGSLDPFDVEQVREETARDIVDASRAGTVPGGLIRDADEILNPKVDWRRQLSRWMRNLVAQVSGQADYSFSRRSRASLHTPYYLPGLRDREPPVLKIVLDTSGSMRAADLATGLSEICAILDQTQRNSGGSIELINCDAGTHSTDKIRDVKQIVIRGGGGTDMRVGMKIAAEARRPIADVIIIITDGGTPWMEQPPRANPRAHYVVLLVEQEKGSNLEEVASRIPRWMHVIPAYR